MVEVLFPLSVSFITDEMSVSRSERKRFPMRVKVKLIEVSEVHLMRNRREVYC